MLFMTGIFHSIHQFTFRLFYCQFYSFNPTFKSVVQSSKFMLNQSGESRHPCFVTNLRGNALSFSPMSVMLAVGLSFRTFIILKKIPLSPIYGEILS